MTVDVVVVDDDSFCVYVLYVLFPAFVVSCSCVADKRLRETSSAHHLGDDISAGHFCHHFRTITGLLFTMLLPPPLHWQPSIIRGDRLCRDCKNEEREKKTNNTAQAGCT